MKLTLGLGLLVVVTSPVASQAQPASRVAVEGVAGVARFTESFTSDCCGPSNGKTGSSFSLRLKYRVGPLTEIGAEGGVTFAGHRDMKWLMATASITSPKRVAPWGQLGAGLLSQPGECPQDGSDPGPGCKTDLNAGASVGGGVRWKVGARFAIGLEAALVSGLARRSRRFTTTRIGLVLRLQ